MLSGELAHRDSIGDHRRRPGRRTVHEPAEPSDAPQRVQQRPRPSAPLHLVQMWYCLGCRNSTVVRSIGIDPQDAAIAGSTSLAATSSVERADSHHAGRDLQRCAPRSRRAGESLRQSGMVFSSSPKAKPTSTAVPLRAGDAARAFTTSRILDRGNAELVALDLRRSASLNDDAVRRSAPETANARPAKSSSHGAHAESRLRTGRAVLPT